MQPISDERAATNLLALGGLGGPGGQGPRGIKRPPQPRLPASPRAPRRRGGAPRSAALPLLPPPPRSLHAVKADLEDARAVLNDLDGLIMAAAEELAASRERVRRDKERMEALEDMRVRAAEREDRLRSSVYDLAMAVGGARAEDEDEEGEEEEEEEGAAYGGGCE